MKLAAMLNKDFHTAAESLARQRISMPVAYKLKKIIDKINRELQNYDVLLNKAKEKHTNEQGEVDQAGFMKDLHELVNMEIPTDKIKLDDLQNTTLSVTDLAVLEPIIDGMEEQQETKVE